jgi:hypothetical protein
VIIATFRCASAFQKLITFLFYSPPSPSVSVPSARFDLHLEAGPAFFCNDQRTRTFAALPVLPASEGFDALARLIRRVDTALRAFSLPRFYEVRILTFIRFFVRIISF